MSSDYVQAALARAEYEPIEEGEYCATIPGLRGVIATGETIEECRKDLIEVLKGWIALWLRLGMSKPPICGLRSSVFGLRLPAVGSIWPGWRGLRWSAPTGWGRDVTGAENFLSEKQKFQKNFIRDQILNVRSWRTSVEPFLRASP